MCFFRFLLIEDRYVLSLKQSRVKKVESTSSQAAQGISGRKSIIKGSEE